MIKEPRRSVKTPGMSLGKRVFLVLLLWVLIAAMAVGCLLPELNLPIGFAGGPPALLVGIFLVAWIVALLQISAKVPYGLAGLLFILGPISGPMVAVATSELYADKALQPTTAVVVATHPRDDSPVPTEFRFDDGTTDRGIWDGVYDCGRVDCYYEVLRPGTQVEVDRDMAGRFPPRGPSTGEMTSGDTALFAGLAAGGGAIVAATSVSVLTRRRSLLQRSNDETEAEKAAA